MTNLEDQAFENLLEYFRQSRGFDFTGYKHSSLKRRLHKQMSLRHIDNFTDYLDYIQVHPEEFLPLFNTILINVTSFFRDPNAWNYLQTQIVPEILSKKLDTDSIRIWTAGCASGEEAYTLAMIWAEALGSEAFRQRVKIYATDVDEEALKEARQAIYTEHSVALIPEPLKVKYFDHVSGKYIFRPDIRRAVIFGRHDLVQDAPISRLDLLVCRNTLMYFNAETQGKILNRFHFALQNSGFLFLGKAEMLLTHSNLFTPVHLQHRIFNRVSKNSERNQLIAFTLNNNEPGNTRLNRILRLRELAFEVSSLATLIFDANNNLLLANACARAMFEVNLTDFGRPLQDLKISYRPVELRSQIDKVYNTKKTVKLTGIPFANSDGTIQYLEMQIIPLQDSELTLQGVVILVADITLYHHLQTELQKANQELETVNEEMQSSNEELETTNEELQSTNEELETTNEELQSTNEELETMNEELQSTNEELQTINDELRQRTSELNQSNAFLNSILASLKAGVIVINQQSNILSWNYQSENLWGLKYDEVEGKSFFGLDIGLPLDQLRESIRNCLDQSSNSNDLILQAINRRGQSIQCRVSINPLLDNQETVLGLILVIDEI
jgi:two-component system, chemotaxis family, CheB/CheR fusion protein